jgi:hypothetical protein
MCFIYLDFYPEEESVLSSRQKFEGEGDAAEEEEEEDKVVSTIMGFVNAVFTISVQFISRT